MFNYVIILFSLFSFKSLIYHLRNHLSYHRGRIASKCIMAVVSKVNSMATNGSLVRLYDPCGLDILHFYKLTPYNIWKAKLNLVFYAEKEEVSIKIVFKNNVTVQVENSNPKGPWNSFQINLHKPILRLYTFKVHINDALQPIPFVAEYSINDYVICNEIIKDDFEKAIDKRLVENKEDHSYLCGRRSFDNTEIMSVIGDAKAGDWPWHVAVFHYTIYKCGGNIISRTAILTAGHCVSNGGLAYESNSVMISAGVANFTNTEYLKSMMRLGVLRQVEAKSIILHPSFLFEKSTSDLAIIKVEPFQFSNSIQPVCIFGPMYEDKVSLIGKNGMVVGFGLTDKDRLSAIQRTSITTVQSDSTCMLYSPTVYEKLLNEFTFCAGLNYASPNLTGINPREGDSGAGLVLPVTQADKTVSWFLRGILSKCVKQHADNEHCDAMLPVVYTDVSPHFSWIQHHRF